MTVEEHRKLEHLIVYGRKLNTPATPSKTTKRKDSKPSRRERWEEKQK